MVTLSAGEHRVEVQCEHCGLVAECVGLLPGVDVVSECEACGGVRVLVESELLVDGAAGLLLDPVEDDEVYAAGWSDGWEFRRWLEAQGTDPDSLAAVDLVVATMSEVLSPCCRRVERPGEEAA